MYDKNSHTQSWMCFGIKVKHKKSNYNFIFVNFINSMVVLHKFLKTI